MRPIIGPNGVAVNRAHVRYRSYGRQKPLGRPGMISPPPFRPFSGHVDMPRQATR